MKESLVIAVAKGTRGLPRMMKRFKSDHPNNGLVCPVFSVVEWIQDYDSDSFS